MITIGTAPSQHLTRSGSRDVSVTTVIGLRVGQPRNRGSIPCRGKAASRQILRPIQTVPGPPSPGDTAAAGDTNCSPPFSAGVILVLLITCLFLLDKKATSVPPTKVCPALMLQLLFVGWMFFFRSFEISNQHSNVASELCRRHQLSGADISVSLQLSHNFLWPSAAFTFRWVILVQVQQKSISCSVTLFVRFWLCGNEKLQNSAY
jgi:hypothetical protein